MGATASLSGTALAVEPGESVDCELQVRNTGRVVDQFTFEVLGDAAPWATVEPESLSLFPDGDGTARVTFAPPRLPQTPAGAVPFAVKVVSHEDPDGTVAEEGVLEVGGFADATAELIPRTSRGRRGGRHDLAFDNRGNQLVDAQLLASDPDNLLTFELAPASLVAEPGTAVFSKVRVRPKHRLWRGQPASHPFQVLVEPQHGVPLAVDGTYLQEPVIPRWLPRALLALLALLLLLVALWFALLRPVVRSAARDAVAEEVAQAEQ
ncbi:MAG: hypothetical protein M3N52_12760, partial [Actinomycetota bacterium]|nr:hypothetical protein [Actinomycetota bacterium]